MINTIADFDKGRNNNFDLIRFIAASLVIYSHSYLVLGHFDNEPLNKWSHFLNFGSIGVYIFFSISGFLITKSLLRQKSLGSFVWARVLRIFPALVVSVMLCCFIVGPLFTSLPLHQYFSDSRTYRFLENSALFRFYNFLPGLFDSNPSRNAVNNPLWTLPAELLMYIVVFFAGIILLTKKKETSALKKSLPVTAGVLLYAINMKLQLSYLHEALPWIIFFLLGACLFIWRDKIALSPLFAVICWGVTIAAILLKLPAYKLLFAGTFIYSIFLIGYYPRLVIRNFAKYGDFSYGLYIYAFPIQQILASRFPILTPFNHFIFSYGLTLPLAFLSWHFIEKPALSMKNLRWEDFKKSKTVPLPQS